MQRIVLVTGIGQVDLLGGTGPQQGTTVTPSTTLAPSTTLTPNA